MSQPGSALGDGSGDSERASTPSSQRFTKFWHSRPSDFSLRFFVPVPDFSFATLFDMPKDDGVPPARDPPAAGADTGGPRYASRDSMPTAGSIAGGVRALVAAGAE